jgi:hypothetical protein
MKSREVDLQIKVPAQDAFLLNARCNLPYA